MNKFRRLFARGISILGNRGFFHNMDDEKYLKLIYPRFIDEKLNLNNPKTFNEKLQWLKIHNRKKEYSIMVDKYAVREYIAKKLGNEYLIDLVGGPWDNAKDIDFNALPNQFVLKCTHDSKSVIICKDKSSFDTKTAIKKLNKHLKTNLYYGGREWPYKDVKPRIIAEKYMVDESGTELKDYKIFNFSGKPELIQVNFGRFENSRKNYYNTNWEYVPLECHFPTDKNTVIKKPDKLDKMLEFSALLSKDIPFLRTDFYSINDKIYFGELTFYPAGGFFGFNPPEWDKKLGDLIDLSLVKKD